MELPRDVADARNGASLKDDTTLLEGIYTRMTKSVCLRAARMRSEAEQTKVIHTKAVDVLKLLGQPTMSALLRQKRLRWVGHALRRDDSDLSKTDMKSELALSSKQWTKCVLSDMQSLEIQTIKDLETKSKKREHFRMMTEAHIL